MGKRYNPYRDEGGKFTSGPPRVRQPKNIKPIPVTHTNKNNQTVSKAASTVFPDAVDKVSAKKETATRTHREFFGNVGLEDRVYQAVKPYQSQIALSILSYDPHPDVRAAIAERDDAGEDVLENLTNDGDTLVLVKLVKNNNLPQSLTKKVWERVKNEPKLWPVKYALLAEGANTPASVVSELCSDADLAIANEANKRMKILKGSNLKP